MRPAGVVKGKTKNLNLKEGKIERPLVIKYDVAKSAEVTTASL